MKRRNVGLLMVFGALWVGLGSGCAPRETGAVMSQEQLTGQTQLTEYKTVDGWRIKGDLFAPEGASKGIVLLLHQRGGSADDWSPLSLALQKAGYTAFAIDQRGTGRSTDGPGQTDDFAPWNTAGDIEPAIMGLKNKGAQGPVAIIGAAYGANNAVLFAGDHPDLVQSLILFSPSTDYHGLKPLDAMKKYKGAVLIFHQKSDKIAGDGPAILDKVSGSKDHKLVVSDGAGHGTALLNAQVTQQTVEFITRTLK